ncbi:hypothetical protein MN116_005088 [Schistosoma mekongi]|uniref:Uncharacterized protein n=1 Tax=Schistosoma mekongi TaxID=38744 RepID=A0AAE2D4Z9_SCHME|nr:hypothetical protein MN116_005088 [Schistosoma mekongi]
MSSYQGSGECRASRVEGSRNPNPCSTSVSQSEVRSYKKEDSSSRTPKSEKNGKHTKSINRESDQDSQSGRGSLSFAVKRSGLSNKLAHTSHFEQNNSDDQDEAESQSYNVKSESPLTGCMCNRRQWRTMNSETTKSSLCTRCTPSSHSDDFNCGHEATKSPYIICKKGGSYADDTPTNPCEQEKSKSCFDAADHTPSNSVNKDLSSKYSASEKHNLATCISHSKKYTTYFDQRHNRSSSNTLVSYNSTDDEFPHDSKENSHQKQKVRRKSDRFQPKKHGSSDTHHSNLSSSINHQITPGKSNSTKVIKSTARSTWDSSDSDFDSSVVHTENASENEHTTSPFNQKYNSLEPSHRTSQSLITKSSSSKEATGDLAIKKKEPKYQDNSNKGDPVNSNESQSKISSRDSLHKRCRKNSGRHHSMNRQRKSISSEDSNGSRCCNNPGTSRNKNTVEGITHTSRKRSRSRRSSYHSSLSRSRYSSRSESSHKYGRRKRSYLKSKSYSSRSSARTSRSFHSSYSSRSSSTRTPRRHRRVRSFYRRRHRHRSYSLRSRSHSKSWHSTESSFSSRSSLSSRSRYFSRRNTSKNRSSSRRSRTPLYRPSSTTRVSEDNVRTPSEHRPAHLGVGLVNKDCTSDVKTISPFSDSKSISYIPSVDETVSAAVKRVVGGGQSKNRKSSRESILTKDNNDDNKMNTTQNSRLAVERSSDSHSQPLSLTSLAQSNNKASSPSVLVDIPLPQDSLNQTTDNSENRIYSNKSVPYIGPQVPPELAKRFGLSVSDDAAKLNVSDPLTSVSSGHYVGISSDCVQLQNTSNSSSDTLLVPSTVKSSNAAEVASFSPPEFTIPPEQVELYRPLQEQAKEHALRRSGILLSDESKFNRNPSEHNLLQQQQVQRQLAFLQQQQQNQASMAFTPTNVIYSTPSLLPLYATNTPLISIPNGSITAPGNISITETVPHQVAAEAMILKQQHLQQQQQLSSLCGAAYQQQANSNDTSQIHLGSISNPNIASNLIVEQPNTSTSLSSSIKPEASQISASIHQAQLQQLIAAAALQSVVQANNSNNILSSPTAVQSINQQQLLNQLIAQQSQLSGLNIAPNLVTASLLAAQQQQKQLITNWQKRALALAAASAANDQLKNIQERRLPIFTPGTTTGNLTATIPTSLASIFSAANSLPALQLGLLRSGINTPILPTGTASSPTQSQVASVAAIIAAAMQQQQQSQQTAAVSAAQQPLCTNPSQFPVSSANSEVLCFFIKIFKGV